MTKERIFLSPPHMSGNEEKYVQKAFELNWIAPLGFNVDAFEKEMCQYVGVKEAAAVTSGTAAIHLALILLGVGKGDVVFCSSLTFIASANPVLYQGAEPVFIDSEPDTWNMSPQALELAFQDSLKNGVLPKAVIVVNLYGQSAKWDEIRRTCEKYDVPIIEDAAESLGSVYKGKASGTLGTFGVYSFNGNKIITTSGGGMLLSNNYSAIREARFLSTQARDPAPHYQHSSVGYNYRMSNILAGIGRGQLEVIEDRVFARRSVFEFYKEHLGHLPGIQFMPELEGTFSNRWLTALTIDEKVCGVSAAEMLKILESENIEARPIWKPLHMQPLFKENKYYRHSDSESISEELFITGICLPSGSNLQKEDQVRIIHCIQNRINIETKEEMYL
ncbi:DegT/DnrJ/EryC1/StrS family aminotransferase [Heyndrickxia acidicola]|uniref:DegT/DnrJ/EryC1/StrS family aminotransferase n=1 Tax=Heyndrickxia acidicola TaxID=209389 RepID=A0ABU6MPQ1_9BACI|nr:DegT/DnrJ/EryC1/StrS family aminotransferase [Heyndrickxia acidicola]MED1205202.1 DegT/DnrJ/EryC1/StrS family aminotransferase [Heyndrickxia acidicola]